MFIFISTLTILHVYEYVNIELAINERLDVFEMSRFSSSGIHLHLIYDGITKAFNEVYDKSHSENINYRLSALSIGLDRVIHTAGLRGYI